jgi:hypothetical protein
MIEIVHCKRNLYDIYIGRPSKWGNPFEIGKDGNRKEVIIKYENWIRSQPNLIKELKKLNHCVLGCWCPPKPCHGNVLIKLFKEFYE